MRTLIEHIQTELASLDAQRAKLLAALAALGGDAPSPAPTAARAVRQSRPPVAPDAEDETARALLKALRAIGGPAPTGAIEARAKTGLSNPALRGRLKALVAQKLVTVTGEGAGTRYTATA